MAQFKFSCSCGHQLTRTPGFSACPQFDELTSLKQHLGYLAAIGTLHCPECDLLMMSVMFDEDSISLFFAGGVQVIGTLSYW